MNKGTEKTLEIVLFFMPCVQLSWTMLAGESPV